MDSLRDQYFSPADAEEWLAWSEELEPEGEELEDYLNTLCKDRGTE